MLLDRAGLLPEARYAAFHAFRHLGGGYLSSLPLDLVTAPDAILADALDGGPLPAKHGGPLRLVVPRQLGYKSVKWVVRIEITDESVPGILGAARLPGRRAGARRVTGGDRRAAVSGWE